MYKYIVLRDISHKMDEVKIDLHLKQAYVGLIGAEIKRTWHILV
jgi:hypothetical protein